MKLFKHFFVIVCITNMFVFTTMSIYQYTGIDVLQYSATTISCGQSAKLLAICINGMATLALLILLRFWKDIK